MKQNKKPVEQKTDANKRIIKCYFQRTNCNPKTSPQKFST